MSIIRTQIARQLLAEGGMPMKKIKGQDHMLAYITPNEANKLVRLGGQKTMTPEGIPAYPEYDNYGYSSQADFDAGDRSKSSDPNVSGGDRNRTTARELAAINALEAIGYSPKKTFKDKVIDSIKKISEYTPFGLVKTGLGSLFNKFGTFAQNMRGGLTQAQYEAARRERQRQNRIANIMGRDAPFTAKTLENLAKLGYKGPLDGLIGSTNITRSATTDDVYPDPVEGIVSQAPTTFRDAMAQLNLERGVPRDQVFLRAEDFIDPSKTISSEDLGTIQSRIEQATGVPMGDIQLAKNYTKEDLEKLGAAPGRFFGANEQLEALEDYYNFAQKQFGMGKDPSAIRDSAKIGSSLYGLNLDLVPKDFLETEQDFKQQKSPFELLDI
tara:strand:+ start:26 stop:1177 length:1152 start_codon:yes stop_codon:yes gene_type:complete